MAETVRDIRITIEVETNKRTEKVVIDLDYVGGDYRQLGDAVDDKLMDLLP